MHVLSSLWILFNDQNNANEFQLQRALILKAGQQDHSIPALESEHELVMSTAELQWEAKQQEKRLETQLEDNEIPSSAIIHKVRGRAGPTSQVPADPESINVGLRKVN